MDRPPWRRPYPVDVSDDEAACAAPALTRTRPDAPRRVHHPRAVGTARRWIVRAGAPGRMGPTTFPPRDAVPQPTRRRPDAGGVEELGHDRRAAPRRGGWGRRPDRGRV